EAGDLAGARKTYEDLAATANLAPEVRQDCELQIVDLLLDNKKFAEAQARVQSQLKSVPPTDARAARATVYLAKCLGATGKLGEAVAQLENIIAKTTDKDLKALAYNALGDCYRWNQKPREALWPYL